MPSLKPTTSLGGSISSLIKSAASLQNSINANMDEQMRINWDNSGYTDAAFQEYSSYLNKRIDTLNATGSITDNTKALGLSQTLEEARRSNVRSNITQENTQVLAGNATTTDKLNLVMKEAQLAQSVNDDTLYQSLESQAYSLSQQVQKEAADAAVASDTLSRVNSALSALGMGSTRGSTSGVPSGANQNWVSQITAAAKKYGVDPNAALAVASVEGLSGAVGDGGTSFGPFQLHVGGALPAGKGRAWAESPEGIDYAIKTMAGVAKGLTGQAAVQAIVTKFERPADPSGEVARAMSVYGGSFNSSGPLTAAQAAIQSGNFTLSDLATASKDQLDTYKQQFVGAANALQAQVKSFNQDFAKVGTNGQNKAVSAAVKQMEPIFQELKVSLPSGAKPNYGDLMQGYYLAIHKAYSMAAIAASAFDPTQADPNNPDSYTYKANQYATGQATIDTLVKGTNGSNMKMNLFDLQQLADSIARPGTNARFMPTSDGTFIEKPQAGFQFGQLSGGRGFGVEASYLANPYTSPESQFQKPVDDPNAYVSAPLDLTTTLNKYKLQFKPSTNGYAHEGENVLVTNQTADFIKKVAKPGTVLQVYNSPKGLQFQAKASGGFSGNSVYTIIRDGSGKGGLYEEGPDGTRLIGGEYGFNSNNPDGSKNGTESQGFLGRLLSIATKNTYFSSMFGHGNPNLMIQSAAARAYEVHQQQIAEQNRIAAQKMLEASQHPAPLPQITVNNSPAPSKPLSIYHPPALQPIQYNPAPQPVAPRTFNPQPATSNPLQGGSFNLQGGGGGIRLQ